jgi:dUTP pyrophosphatase
MQVAIQILAHGAGLPMPAYATSGSAGCDVRAAIDSPLTLRPGGRAVVPVGFSMALPTGWEAQVRPRSGLAVRHGVTVLNAPGTIDSDYRGEVMVPLVNLGDEPFVIERGERIAQLVIAPFHQVEWNVVSSLDATERGLGGFGSTGRS